MSYEDPYEKFVHMPVQRIAAAPSIVPRERVQGPAPAKPAPARAPKSDPVKAFRLSSSFNWHVQPETLHSLAKTVSKHSGVPASDILGHRRQSHTVKARHIVLWLAKRFTHLSAAAMGAEVGRADHVTILYSIARVDLAIREVPIAAPASDTPEAWAAVLWSAQWPDLKRRNPRKLRA